MKGIVAGIGVHLLMIIVAFSCAFAQQSATTSIPVSPSASATPVTSPSAAPSPFTIRQNFLRQQASTIQIDIRAAQRCIQIAQQTLVDVEGNINRVAQTDLVNCGRRLAQLAEALTKLDRTSAKLAQDAAAQAQIAAGLLKQQQALQSVSKLPILRGGKLNPLVK